MGKEDDFVDASQGNRQVRLLDTDIQEIRENKGGLTREGCLVKIQQWASSNNKQVLIKYLAMLRQCKILEKSGKTQSGKTILARRKHILKSGVPERTIWSEEIDINQLEAFAQSKMINLRFLTTKGG